MTGSHPLELASASTAVLWLILIMHLHFIRPEHDPRTRMISEYTRGPHGGIMRVACGRISESRTTQDPHSDERRLFVSRRLRGLRQVPLVGL